MAAVSNADLCFANDLSPSTGRLTKSIIFSSALIYTIDSVIQNTTDRNLYFISFRHGNDRDELKDHDIHWFKLSAKSREARIRKFVLPLMVIKGSLSLEFKSAGMKDAPTNQMRIWPKAVKSLIFIVFDQHQYHIFQII